MIIKRSIPTAAPAVRAAALLEGGVYKLWYSGAGQPWQTGYATSPDGITWAINPGNPVLQVGAPGSWDEQEADGMVVIKDGTTYKMWYHGANQDYSTSGIGYATSPDGVTWTKHPTNPVLVPTSGSWDESGVSWPRVIKNGATFEMWYFSSSGQVGRATSPDGVTWTKYGGNPVIDQDWEGKGLHGGSVLAALAGGIGANRARPADFFYINLMMGVQLIH